jgi:hypothetical protein
MADPADQATMLAQDDVDQGVAAARGRVPDPGQPGPRLCPECEDNEIPEARRQLGYQECVECAADREAGRL